MLEDLKKEVFNANLELVKQNLVVYTWGNVSQIDQNRQYVVIKPSGVSYDTMKVDDMVVVDLDGKIIEGSLKPSSDTPTHLALYKAFKDLNSVVHTHSEYATSFAQAKKSIPVYGTTHCDYFYGDIPCTRPLTEKEVNTEYELNTGLVIINTFNELKKSPIEIPGILVSEHGPFAFGKHASDAVHHAKVLEEVAKMAFKTISINPNITHVNQYLLHKHYLRKHGKNAYYGQTK
jgi:L-ribulose-5-phosphate 4-epimerase